MAGMVFKKAERKQSKLRLAISGPSGSGKSYSSLLIAKGMGGRVAVIDTEQGSASLYTHLLDFDALALDPPYTPERYIEAIHAAVSAKYDILIIDSMTHEWDGAGGCLEANEVTAASKFKGNTWSAWSVTTPRHRAFVDAILQAPIHVICTLRSKTETVQGEGKKVMKLGLKSIQRDNTDYEFTTVLDLSNDNHYANASKDRTELFKQPEVITPATGKKLLAWLNSGAVVKEEPKPAPVPQPQHRPTPTVAHHEPEPAEPFDADYHDEAGPAVTHAAAATKFLGLVAGCKSADELEMAVKALGAAYAQGQWHDDLIPAVHAKTGEVAAKLVRECKSADECKAAAAVLRRSVFPNSPKSMVDAVTAAFAEKKQQFDAAKPAAPPPPSPFDD